MARVIIKPPALEVCLVPTGEAVAQTEDPTSDASAQTEDPGLHDPAPCSPADDYDHASLDRAKLSGREGHHSCALRKAGNETRDRDGLLTAIAKARGWIDDLRLGRIGSFV